MGCSPANSFAHQKLIGRGKDRDGSSLKAARKRAPRRSRPRFSRARVDQPNKP